MRSILNKHQTQLAHNPTSPADSTQLIKANKQPPLVELIGGGFLFGNAADVGLPDW